MERSENRLRHVGRGPKLTDYLDQTYLPRFETSGKKPDTLVTEKGHLNRWRESIGHLFLDKVRPYHFTGHLQKLKTEGRGQPNLQYVTRLPAEHAQERQGGRLHQEPASRRHPGNAVKRKRGGFLLATTSICFAKRL